ncbi:hypothetical protein VI03_00410 [Burkholderia vietnamiensis]|nr:hypothetical protein VI03_00410 [Burkholderia vietnamiensis]
MAVGDVQWDERARRYLGDREGLERLIEQVRSVPLKGPLPACAGQREGFAPLGLGTRVRQSLVAGHVYAQRAFETEGGDTGAALDAATVRELGQNSALDGG